MNDHLGSSFEPCYIQNHVIMNRVIKRLKWTCKTVLFYLNVFAFACSLVNTVKHVDKMGPLQLKKKKKKKKTPKKLTLMYPSKTDDPDQPKHSDQNMFCFCKESMANDQWVCSHALSDREDGQTDSHFMPKFFLFSGFTAFYMKCPYVRGKGGLHNVYKKTLNEFMAYEWISYINWIVRQYTCNWVYAMEVTTEKNPGENDGYVPWLPTPFLNNWVFTHPFFI